MLAYKAYLIFNDFQCPNFTQNHNMFLIFGMIPKIFGS